MNYSLPNAIRLKLNEALNYVRMLVVTARVLSLSLYPVISRVFVPAMSSVHHCLSYASLYASAKFSPVQSVMLSIHFLGGLALSVLPSTVPYKTVLMRQLSGM